MEERKNKIRSILNGILAVSLIGITSNIFAEGYRCEYYIKNAESEKERENVISKSREVGLEIIIPFYSLLKNKYEGVENIK